MEKEYLNRYEVHGNVIYIVDTDVCVYTQKHTHNADMYVCKYIHTNIHRYIHNIKYIQCTLHTVVHYMHTYTHTHINTYNLSANKLSFKVYNFFT